MAAMLFLNMVPISKATSPECCPTIVSNLKWIGGSVFELNPGKKGPRKKGAQEKRGPVFFFSFLFMIMPKDLLILCNMTRNFLHATNI